MDLLVGHLFGDYILQDDWMAEGKKRSSWICSYHCMLWSVSVWIFSGFQFPWWALLIAFSTHFVQDRWNLVQRWMKINGQEKFMKPPMGPWSIIVVDNVFHLLVLQMLGKVTS